MLFVFNAIFVIKNIKFFCDSKHFNTLDSFESDGNGCKDISLVQHVEHCWTEHIFLDFALTVFEIYIL